MLELALLNVCVVVASEHDLAATRLDQVLESLDCVAIDKLTKVIIVENEAFDLGDEELHELVSLRLMHINVVDADACLTSVLELCRDHLVCHMVKVGCAVHDDGTLTAQLENARDEVLGSG